MLVGGNENEEDVHIEEPSDGYDFALVTIRTLSAQPIVGIDELQRENIFHIRPWQYDRYVIHDGRKNHYNLKKDGCTHALVPLSPSQAHEDQMRILRAVEERKRVREKN
ncbi:hypothetical protein GH714_039044 [Hevea brasiliensis]|uniref:Uncharacterized protein n=1 Tax=Hevea brasiliensis TaxID=3981 RepID=A0A6A6N6S2_HEVBR|nr:hypothetical protein GH714_039044 [Hevea brasiliensis]